MTTPSSVSVDSSLRLNGLFDSRTLRRRNVLDVQPPNDTPDGFVAAALTSIDADAGGATTVREVNERLVSEGLIEAVGKATTKLNLGGIDRTQRLLLSVPSVYASVVAAGMAPVSTTNTSILSTAPTADSSIAASRRRVNFDDTASLVDFILRAVDAAGGFREQYARKLVESVIDTRGLSVSALVRATVISDVALRELPTAATKVDELIVSLLAQRRSTMDLETAVDEFSRSGEIDPVRFTPSIRRSMVTFLKDIGVKFPVGGVTSGNRAQFDEYFAIAYNHAARAGDGSTVDPIDAVRQKGAITEWDFTVDTFETVEEQGVVPQNILAAGALDYVYNLGERLGMFRLADGLVLRWASGAFDAEPGKPSADLYRYWKLRSERISPEERAMMYRRILAKGDGKMLSGMVENEAFPELWGTLMEKATDFLRRSEDNASTERTVSRQPIYQATKQLQYDLTEHATGMAHMQITEMYHHLLEAKQVLEHAINFFSTGSRKSLWTVIERASREWFNEAPNIAAVRSSAIDGNRVFQWIAGFDQSSTTDEEFQGFLEASESWILAQATDDSAPTDNADGDAPELEDEELNDDTDDWDK